MVSWADAENPRARREPSHCDVRADAAGGPCTCPCCGHRTLPQRGVLDWSAECHREDDGQDEHDLDVVRAGPNGSLSLRQARAESVRRGGDRQPHEPTPLAP